MLEFLRGDADVLVCTTIIESGLDIPTANTLIVERADRLGLAQLYQIRGRVGPLARARLRLPALSQPRRRSARRRAARLATLSDYTELGSGFKIAMRDLEIRGAGNLLGEEQSGHVAAVGFELYVGDARRGGARCSAGDGGRRDAPEPVRIDVPVDAYVPGRLRALRGRQDRDPPAHRGRPRGRPADRAARGARGPLRARARPAREPDPPPGRAHQARPRRRAHGRTSAADVMSRRRRSSSTRAGAKALRERVPRRSSSPAAAPCAVRLPEEPAERFRAVVAAAEAILETATAEPRLSVRYPSPPLWHGSPLQIAASRWPCTGVAAAHRRPAETTSRPNAVAKVGDETITQDEFNKWVDDGRQEPGARARPPSCPTRPTTRSASPPRRSSRRRRARASRPTPRSRSSARPSTTTLKREVMQFLIQSEWVAAGGRQARASRSATRPSSKSFEDQKKQAFPNDKAYQKFLKTSGMTEADILFRVKLDAAPGEAHAEGHRGRQEGLRRGRRGLLQQEQAALRPARAARPARGPDQDQGQGRRRPSQALESGQTWKTVAKQYSIDEASKAQGGKLAARRQGPAGQGARRRGLRAPRRASSGPGQDPVRLVRLRGRRRSRPASQQSLDQARDTIKNLLRSQRQQKALDEFVKDFRERVQGQDELRGRLPRRRVQERAEGRRPSTGREPVGRSPNRQTQPAPQSATPRTTARTPEQQWRTISQPRSLRLDEITRRLRRECPWDREQDERSIVPHTVEEAYELADAAHSGDDAKLLDELGDVLFQVYFLSLLLEERGAGDLAAGGRPLREKLIRRHPHVFGDGRGRRRADEVVRNWDAIKRDDERGGGDLRGHAREPARRRSTRKKVQRAGRADAGSGGPPSGRPAGARPEADRELRSRRRGELLFAAVAPGARRRAWIPSSRLRACRGPIQRRGRSRA